MNDNFDEETLTSDVEYMFFNYLRATKKGKHNPRAYAQLLYMLSIRESFLTLNKLNNNNESN